MRLQLRVEVEVRVAVSERIVEDVGVEERVRLLLLVDEREDALVAVLLFVGDDVRLQLRVEVEVRVAASERIVEDVGVEERVRLLLRVDE